MVKTIANRRTLGRSWVACLVYCALFIFAGSTDCFANELVDFNRDPH